jgi:hypothetical protein
MEAGNKYSDLCFTQPTKIHVCIGIIQYRAIVNQENHTSMTGKSSVFPGLHVIYKVCSFSTCKKRIYLDEWGLCGNFLKNKFI